MPPLANTMRGSFKRQIILTFVVGFLLIATAFAVYFVHTESTYRYREKHAEAIGLSWSLAVSSHSWVLANDVQGLQEVVHAFQSYPELRYAMVLSPQGRVLAHNDAGKVGMFISDPESQSLLSGPSGLRTLVDNASLVDVAVPIVVDAHLLGWARIGLGREQVTGELHRMAWSIGLFILFALVLSLLAAYLIANRLGRRIGILVSLADKVQAGNFETRATIPGAEDEISKLAGSLNQMLDTLAENTRQLRRSERGLSEAQRIAHLGNWELDLTNDRLSWSDEIFRIFEIDQTQFGASYEAFLNAIHPDDREGVNQAYTDSVANKAPYDIVHRLRMPDGRIKYVNERCETNYDANGRPLRSVGTVHDITDYKLAEAQINELNRSLEQRVAERTAQLQAANHELEAFAFSVSHDLRAPLRAIDGFTRILEEDYEARLDAEGRRLLGVVRESANRMAQLIDDILSFSRMGRRDMEAENLDLAELARQTFNELKAGNPARKLSLVIGDLPGAQGDRAMLRQVLVNLLSNAIKFSAPREEALIELGGHCVEHENVYFVRDNGVGFDKRYADKLFGVFQRLHGNEEFEGTGIGLAIVKRIIERHGGRVWAESELGVGATFYFTLPVAQA